MKEEEKEQEDFQKDLEKKSNEIKGGSKYGDILSRVIHEGEELFKIHNRAMFLSGVIAGLEIGFSYLLVCAVYFSLGGKLDEQIVLKLFSLVYPVGFILVILGKSALFTEQTSVLALPVLNGQRSIGELLRVWGLVIFGNVLGGMFFVYFISKLGPHMHLFDEDTMVKVAVHVLDYQWWVLLLSAITAGWLMGLLTWLLNSTINSLTRLLLIYLITGVIGFGGFHHSIVGNLEVFGGLINSDQITFLDYLWFLFLALAGNGIGGAIVVGLFKYRIFESHFTDEKKKQEEKLLP
ncbi:formate/nitrite transporter family protein [Aequorivita sp. H23M31]|uniref:Formate/nitrite transporter family protein n=1 Tax=Aequorivita ciconiae TaxID=2494375 RepID=A0A410G5R9_9FLAO|nr:formate/nitrite transporter family protein [Aequorivita sp. H23M31]QAA82609.1 formate/nitrite transporter family protein [Aequorivita sp. H23M31]